MILVKKLIDPESGMRYYVFFESGNIRRPIMILDAVEYESIGKYFAKEVNEGD